MADSIESEPTRPATYDVDDRDEVLELRGVPRPSGGAPMPLVISDDDRVVLAYLLDEPDPDWDGPTLRAAGPSDDDDPFAIVCFSRCRAHMSGPPNDEAFSGHPLASRRPRWYRAYEVRHSSWIRRLERMNSVHPHHDPERYRSLRHLLFPFKECTFECVCEAFDARVGHGSLAGVIPEMSKLLQSWR